MWEELSQNRFPFTLFCHFVPAYHGSLSMLMRDLLPPVDGCHYPIYDMPPTDWNHYHVSLHLQLSFIYVY